MRGTYPPSTSDAEMMASDYLAFSPCVTRSYNVRCNPRPLHILTAVQPPHLSSTEISVYEYDGKGHRFNRDLFAKSNCWGCRPFLMRGAFDPDVLINTNNSDVDPPWPAWGDVVSIASDEDSESR